MKKLTSITLSAFLFLIVQSCKLNNCEGYACLTPPKLYQFNLVDKNSNENIFTKGLYKASDVKVIDTKTGKVIQHKFVAENNQNIIVLNNIGWQTESVSYKLMLKDDITVFTFEVDAERKNENCCSFTHYNKEELKGAEFTVNDSKDVYTILISSIEPHE